MLLTKVDSDLDAACGEVGAALASDVPGEYTRSAPSFFRVFHLVSYMTERMTERIVERMASSVTLPVSKVVVCGPDGGESLT